MRFDGDEGVMFGMSVYALRDLVLKTKRFSCLDLYHRAMVDQGIVYFRRGKRGFTILLGFPKAGSFSMQFWCSEAIVFWWMEVYTRCQLSHIKVLKRSNFVYNPILES